MTAEIDLSVVMPTRDRRLLARQGIEYFERSIVHQGRRCELIIVDGGCSSLSAQESRGHRRIEVAANMPIGDRLNIGFAAARGRTLARQDDDDWLSPHWLALALAALESSTAQIVGSNAHFSYDIFSGRSHRCVLPGYDFGRAPWVIGGTMMFRRETWERRGFASIVHSAGGEDFLFQENNQKASGLPSFAVPGSENHFVYIRHGRNATGLSVAPQSEAGLEAKVRAILGGDLRWYEELAEVVRDLTPPAASAAWHLPGPADPFSSMLRGRR